MQFGFTNLGSPTWNIEQTAEAARRFGYEGVELRLLDGEVIDPLRHREAVAKAVATFRQHGLEVCAFDTSCKFNLADEAARESHVQDLVTWIGLAQALHVPLLRVFGGAARPEEDRGEAQSIAWVGEALKAAAPEAERARVSVALETHDAFSSARRVAKVLEIAASPRIGALWDTHHPYRVGESPDEVLDLLGARLLHVHVKDARRDASDRTGWKLVLLGEGEVPVAASLQALARRGYAGWVCVEWEKKWHPEIAEPEVALPQHLRWLKEHAPA